MMNGSTYDSSKFAEEIRVKTESNDDTGFTRTLGPVLLVENYASGGIELAGKVMFGSCASSSGDS